MGEGAPAPSPKDIIRLCEKHRDMAFHAFTNGTLIDEEFCREMLRVGNFFVSISVEGFEAANDGHLGQPFNGNHLRPCPMLENPDVLPKLVAESGAHSTDLEAPESAEHLCEKCTAYAECWKPEAEKLWAEEHS